jgi:hypothetical protein
LLCFSDDGAEGVLILPAGGCVVAWVVGGGGHGDQACVCVDCGGFCGGLVVGCSEVGLGFMGAHFGSVIKDLAFAFCFCEVLVNLVRGGGLCDVGCRIMGSSWF